MPSLRCMILASVSMQMTSMLDIMESYFEAKEVRVQCALCTLSA